MSLSFILLAPLVVAQDLRRPLGIYAKDDISIDIANRKAKGESIKPAALNDYFINLYQLLLKDPSVSGLEIQIHRDTVNPNPPGTNGDYVWDYLDDAFAQVKLWNKEHPTSPPKTIMLIVTPGFQSPKWVMEEIASCDFLFALLKGPEPPNCGRVTFEGFTEEADGDQFPLPWDAYYKDQWGIFLQALADKYLSNTELVSISVAGPTAASSEMIVPNTDNMPLQKQFDPPIGANEMWFKLLAFDFPDNSAYWSSDEVFIKEWENAIDLYGSIFPGITLVATTGSGLSGAGAAICPRLRAGEVHSGLRKSSPSWSGSLTKPWSR